MYWLCCKLGLGGRLLGEDTDAEDDEDEVEADTKEGSWENRQLAPFLQVPYPKKRHGSRAVEYVEGDPDEREAVEEVDKAAVEAAEEAVTAGTST